MELQSIFDNLTYGELRQVSLGGYKEGGVQEKDYQELVQHINMAMTELYTRFPINEKEFMLYTLEGKTVYDINTKYSFSADPQEEDWYIQDTVDDPFMDDILRINGVFNCAGIELPINDEFSCDSVFLPSFRSIQIPFAKGNEEFCFVYRARPTKISPALPLDLTQDVYLPEVLLEPLLTYIEYRVHKSRGGEAGLAQAGVAKRHFEELCAQIEVRNVLNNANNTTNIKFELNGWV
jgi:hypothetical protein